MGDKIGYCPNIELLQFMALATSGAYLQHAPPIDQSEPYLYDMNIYHEAFLAWSFRKCLEGVSQQPVMPETDFLRKGRLTEIKNPYFEAAAQEEDGLQVLSLGGSPGQS